jgi:hypothetical protein
MKNRWRLGAVLVALLVAGCRATSPAGTDGPAPAESGSAGPVTDFAGFLEQVHGARYVDYAGRPGTQVRDAARFEAMRQYLLDRYGHLSVAGSYRVGDAVFDCVARDASPGVVSTPVAPPSAPLAASPDVPPVGGAAASQSPSCQAGSIPVRRITLADLVRFTDLAAFLGKDPGGGGVPPVPAPSGG